MNISSRHSNSNFAHPFDFHCLTSFVKKYQFLFGVTYNVNCRFTTWKVTNGCWAKFELEYLLLIFFYSNSNSNVTCKNANFNCWFIRMHTEENRLKFLTLLSPFCFLFCFVLVFFGHKRCWVYCHPEYSGVYFSWWNLQICSKWFILTQRTQNLEFVNFKCVTCSQPIPLP